jgi:hypothetical protein
MEFDEHAGDRGRKRRVHREPVALPIGTEPERAKRFVDGVAVDGAPLPRTFEKRVPAEALARQPFFRELAYENGFGRDRGMILAGQPVRVLAEHPMIACQHVHRTVRGRVSEMRAAGDVGRRHRDDERGARGIGLFMKDARREPGRVPSRFDFGRFVGFGKIVRSRSRLRLGHDRTELGLPAGDPTNAVAAPRR